MPVNQLYHTWIRRIEQLRPNERKTRVRNFVWLLVGIYHSKSVHLSKIANKIPGSATLNSIIRRITRFLNNPAFRVRDWYRPVAQALLERSAEGGHPIRLIADGTKVGFGHQLLMVAVAYRRRALPIAWTWVKGARGHSSSCKQLALLAYVRSLTPTNAKVLLVGDCEFGAISVIKQLNEWRWDFVLRQKASHKVKLQGQELWQPLGDLIQHTNQRLWCGEALLTQLHAYPVKLLAYWQTGEKEPWLLATSLPSLRLALAAYRLRMWIEEMFGDFKKHGFDLESTHLRHFLRLSRLTLAVAFLYVWLVAYGSRVIKAGQRRLVDRADRRDLSIFRIGYNMAERRLTRLLRVPVFLIPYL